MNNIGDTVRLVRKSFGLKQNEAAKQLNISVVHLCNIENNKAKPSPELQDRFREQFKVDLYILTWCLNRDESRLPTGVRDAAQQLADMWLADLKRNLPPNAVKDLLKQ